MTIRKKTILYGFQGDGRGHASRAEVVVRELAKRHQVILLTTRPGEKKLTPELKQLPGVVIAGNIFSPRLYFKKNRVKVFKTTVFGAIDRLIREIPALLRGIKIYSRYKPDLIISDLEPCSALLAFFTGTRLVSFDHQHILTDCEIKCSPKLRRDFFSSRFMVKWMVPVRSIKVITSFFFPPVKKKNTWLFKPILRKEIISSRDKVREENFILVYQTTPETFEIVDPALKEVSSEKFVVYNMGREYQDGNVTYKDTSIEGFIQDLCSCKAVICNGGSTLIGESVFLGKPVLSIPLANNFEQILNSLYLKKLSYGQYSREFTGEEIKRFLIKSAQFRSEVKDTDFCGNKEITDFILNLV